MCMVMSAVQREDAFGGVDIVNPLGCEIDYCELDSMSADVA